MVRARWRVHGVTMTRTDANKQIVDEFINALFTTGDLSAVDRYLDPGFVNHDPPFPAAPDGPEGMRQARDVPTRLSRLAQRPAAADRRGRPRGRKLHRPRHPPRRAHGRSPHRTRGRPARGQHLPHRRREDRRTVGPPGPTRPTTATRARATAARRRDRVLTRR